MRALFIQQDHLSPPGPVGDRFRHHGYEVVEFAVVPAESFDQPNISVDLPDPLDFDVIVPMGAPWAVYDDAVIGAWIGQELALLTRAHDAGAPEQEVGWYTIDSDDPDLISTGPWFQWHGDQFTSPPGAREFASTAVGPQAFTIGRSLGVQFHPEITPDQLISWIDNGGASYLRSVGIDIEEFVATARGHADAAALRTHALVDAFLARVVTATPPAPGDALSST